MRNRKNYLQAFTLIEILVVIGMIGILSATVLVAINPLHQFAQARNTQRISNVNAILNAIGNRVADNQGVFAGNSDCPTNLPSTPTMISNAAGGFDLRKCLVPIYISELPADPVTGTNACTNDDCTDSSYTTGYTVSTDSSRRVTVCAPETVPDGMELPYCLRR